MNGAETVVENGGWLAWVWGWVMLAGMIFWIWMLVDAIRTGAGYWIFLIIFLNIPGALIYFFLHKLPMMDFEAPSVLGRWTRAKEISAARRDARNIGNPRQFAQLGLLYRQTVQPGRAREAYEAALRKDPEHRPSLWGLGEICLEAGEYERARELLGKVLAQEPEYRAGAPALAYCKALYKLGEFDEAQTLLGTHLQLQHAPEGQMLLAKILHKRGQASEARDVLEKVLDETQATPDSRGRRLRRQARKLKLLLR